MLIKIKKIFRFKKLFIIPLIFSILLSVNALQIDNPQYQPLTIHPGDDVDVWFKITNDNYDNEIRDITVKITPHYPFELKQVNPDIGEATISHLNTGESDTVYFKLHVDENAPSRDYRIDVTVSYDEVEDEKGEEIIIHHEFTKVYYLPVYGIANFEIDANNLTLTPAKTQTIPITIINKGTGTAKEVSLNLGNNNFISPVDKTKFYLGALKPGEKKTVYIKLHTSDNALEGSYIIPSTITWIDEDGTQRTENINLGFVVRGDILLGISNVVTEPKEIKPGNTYCKIEVTVTNNGHGEAKDVELNLIAKYPFKDSWSSCNIKNIGTLHGGESKTVTFYIDVDKYANSGHYEVPINITYLDIFNKEHSTTKTIIIYIKPKPIFEILTKEVKVEAGKENKVYITIKNIGNEKAENVKISAIRSSGQPFDYPQKSDTIGTLYPGENGTGVIVIDVDKDANPKEYIITLEIRCAGDRDEGDDNIYISQKPLKVVVKNSDGGNFGTMIGLIIIIIALVAIGYYQLKRKKQ